MGFKQTRPCPDCDFFSYYALVYLEVALVPAVLGQSVPQLLVAPHCLQHVGRCLGLAARLAEKVSRRPSLKKWCIGGLTSNQPISYSSLFPGRSSSAAYHYLNQMQRIHSTSFRM